LACRIIRLPLVFAGGRPTNPLHTSDRETSAAPGRRGRNPRPPPQYSRSFANRTCQMPGPVPFVTGSPPCRSAR